MMLDQAKALEDLRTNPQQAASEIQAAATEAQTAIDGLHADMNDAYQKKDYTRLRDDLQLLRSIIDNQHAFQYEKSLEMRRLARYYRRFLPGYGYPPSQRSLPRGGNSIDPGIYLPPGPIPPGDRIPQGGSGDTDPGTQPSPGGSSSGGVWV